MSASETPNWRIRSSVQTGIRVRMLRAAPPHTPFDATIHGGLNRAAAR